MQDMLKDAINQKTSYYKLCTVITLKELSI